jgi:hypothetical protein
LNQHALRQQILSLPRLPFHHWGSDFLNGGRNIAMAAFPSNANEFPCRLAQLPCFRDIAAKGFISEFKLPVRAAAR